MKIKLLLVSLLFIFLVSILSISTPKLQIGDGGLISGKPCSAPCFWNITPGITSEERAVELLSTTGNIARCDHWEAVEFGLEKGIGCENLSIYFDNQNTVSELSVRPSKRITVEQILAQYGNPDALYVKAEGIDMKGPYRIDLIYSEPHLVIGLRTRNKKYFDVKPTTAVDRILYSNPNEFSRFIGVFNQPWKGYGRYQYANTLPAFGQHGPITEDEAHEAYLIVYALHLYGIEIEVDWGKVNQTVGFNDPHDRGKSGTLTVDAWKEGRWTLDELYLVQAAVENMDSTFNHHLNKYLGAVQISKVDRSTFPGSCNGARGCTTGNHIQLADNHLDPEISPDLANLSSYNVIESGSVINFDQWTVVHELGHVWQNHYIESNQGFPAFEPLSAQLVTATGGQTDTPGSRCFLNNWKPGCNEARYFFREIPVKGANNDFNPQEDFSESVAAYVFPASTQRLVESAYGKNAGASDEQMRELYYEDYSETVRWNFIHDLISSGQPY